MLPNFYRRKAHTGDAYAILCLYRDSIRNASPPEHSAEVLDLLAPEIIPRARLGWLAHRMRRGTEETVLAFGRDGIMAGFGSVLPRRSLLRALYVAPAKQRLGVGRLLLDALEAMAAARDASTLSLLSTPGAEAFYRFHGFTSIGLGRLPLGDGLYLTRIEMKKQITVAAESRAAISS
jgi:GNAT superfamily N-acetyltransferase